MSDSETDSPSIKALIVFRENGETDNLFVPILCDAIRMAGIDVRCSTKEFWDSDKHYDIIHFQWPEEVVGNCAYLYLQRDLGRSVRRAGHYAVCFTFWISAMVCTQHHPFSFYLWLSPAP